jgi:uncharacterized protein (DUF2252 family)
METQGHVDHPTLDERRSAGKEARTRTPRSAHEGWKPAADRPDPVALLGEQDRIREQDLVPVRHGRMLVSPFTFYRGAAKIMTEDLQHIPRAGLDVQLCGDAHLSNFGVFASPERTLLFDLNDFDETLPGPFEYDVARLAASFVVAARNNGFVGADVSAAAQASVASYRTAMAQFAEMNTLDIWYSRLDAQALIERAMSAGGKQQKAAVARGRRNVEKAYTKTSIQALSKLTEIVDGDPRIISTPPVVIRGEDFAGIYNQPLEAINESVHTLLTDYRATLQEDHRRLLERFEYIEFARKVVGVGSVGTRAWIVLLRGRDNGDPLILQVKEAMASVLEDHLPASQHEQPGERVVRGQRMMQASSDIFLGWTKAVEAGRYYYWRQLRDMKGSALVELMDPGALSFYGDACGWTLARAHARSGDPVAISAYLGSNDTFDRAMTDFAVRYADQNQSDYERFQEAVRSGEIEATEGV